MLFQDLVGTNPEAVRLLAGSEVRRVSAGRLERSDSIGDASDGVRLDFPLTHDLLAEMIGSARETVSRAIDRLEQTGFLVRDGRSYRLQVRPDALSAP